MAKTIVDRTYLRAVHHLELDVLVLFGSIALAYVLVRSGIFTGFIPVSQGLLLVSAFVAGVFFTSMVTAAAASVALAEIGLQAPEILPVALIGAFGAVCGDMLLFLFIRDTLTQDLKAVIKPDKYRKLVSFFHGGFFRFLSPVIGGIIIASPLPDEAGLALMGMTKVRSYYVIPLSFIMNVLGIWGIISVAELL